jgi:hypothetical protein
MSLAITSGLNSIAPTGSIIRAPRQPRCSKLYDCAANDDDGPTESANPRRSNCAARSSDSENCNSGWCFRSTCRAQSKNPRRCPASAENRGAERIVFKEPTLTFASPTLFTPLVSSEPTFFLPQTTFLFHPGSTSASSCFRSHDWPPRKGRRNGYQAVAWHQPHGNHARPAHLHLHNRQDQELGQSCRPRDMPSVRPSRTPGRSDDFN